jgi:hypothetical protein
MRSTIRRAAVVGACALSSTAFATIATPGIGSAAECGWGTVYDAPSNSCVAAPAPPPPPPPPPAWNGDITPYFSVGTCVPIPVPFAPSICAGI